MNTSYFHRSCFLILLTISCLISSKLIANIQEFPSDLVQGFLGLCKQTANLCAKIRVSSWGYKNPFTGSFVVGASIGIPSGSRAPSEVVQSWLFHHYLVLKNCLSHASETCAHNCSKLVDTMISFSQKHPYISGVILVQTIICVLWIAKGVDPKHPQQNAKRSSLFNDCDKYDTTDYWQKEQ